MPILRSEDSPEFARSPGVVVRGLASPGRGSLELTTLRVRIEPGGMVPEHRHDHEEVFTVLSGWLTVVLDGQEHQVGPGDTVMIPPGVLHHVSAGEEEAVVHAATPAGTVVETPEGERRVPPWGE